MLCGPCDMLLTHITFEQAGWSLCGMFLPNETLAGTALRSIQKDTQDNMTIRVAGK